MRALATGLLGLMTAVFVATRFAPRSWSFAPYVGAFAEAGMVGACADWFAVTALFRRPLGLPIPHTAILPRNKTRIGEALGDFIANNFLDPRLLDQRLVAWRPARRLGEWLGDPAHVEIVAKGVAAVAPNILRSSGALGELAAEAARRLARAGPLAPLASKVLAYLWGEGGGRGLVDRILGRSGDYLLAHPSLIQDGVAARGWRWLPKWIDRMVAERLTTGVVAALKDLRDSANPARIALEAEVDRFIERLAEDPEFLAKGEALKERLLGDPAFLAPLNDAWSDLMARFTADPAALRETMDQAARRGLAAIGQWLRDDAAARDRLDLWIRAVLRGALTPGRTAIGGFVAQVVAGWDAEDAARRLERQVGRDLQYIRINGALVGGLVGLAIYTLVRLLGLN
jgi:uncharacterized membrane-anchored protein YjiN (DUF445 family)